MKATKDFKLLSFGESIQEFRSSYLQQTLWIFPPNKILYTFFVPAFNIDINSNDLKMSRRSVNSQLGFNVYFIKQNLHLLDARQVRLVDIKSGLILFCQ